jgi:hypothetical protein
LYIPRLVSLRSRVRDSILKRFSALTKTRKTRNYNDLLQEFKITIIVILRQQYSLLCSVSSHKPGKNTYSSLVIWSQRSPATMGRTIPADKKSCRKLHDKGILSEASMCTPCSELHSKNHSNTFLNKYKDLWQGKCHRTNQPSSSLPSGTSDQANIPTASTKNTPVKRKRSEPELFIGSPGGGVKMIRESTAHGRHFASQKQRRMALRLIAQSKDNEVDRAIAQRLVSMSNVNKENARIELPRGGASKSAINKRRRQGGLLLTGLANMWSKKAKIAPEVIRDEAYKFSKYHQAASNNISSTPGVLPPISLSRSANNQDSSILEMTTPAAESPSAGVAESSRIVAASSAPAPPSEPIEAPLRRASINLPEDFDAPVPKSKRRRLTDPLRQEMGAQVIARIKSAKKTDIRRPILAAFAGYPRKTLEKVTGMKVSNKEFSKIRTHAQYPGPWEPVEKAEIFRNRLSTDTIMAFLHLLGDPNSLQRLAFGQKCVEVLGGRSFVTLDRVETNMPIRTIAARFVVSLFDEATAVLEGEMSIPESHLRCQKIERDSFRRCLSCRNHTGKCAFTSKDGCSMTTARKVVSSLTGGELKSLSGLDDIKVVQGRENFIRIKSLIDKLAEPEESAAMKKQVDEVELFHKTDFQNHLEGEGKHACCCLTCGFFDHSKFPCHWLIVVLCSSVSNNC